MSFIVIAYTIAQAKTPIHSSHKKINNTWFGGCFTYAEDKYPKDVPELLKPKVGGKPGRVLISTETSEKFKPKVSTRVSLGSYEALVEGISKSHTSWWRTVLRGPSGTPGLICFDIEGEFLCK